ncbi:unnamed protein product [Brassica oleracea var. botrytis]|nr:unnamed protein product [Brassica napus]VDD49127.1 unnamed protein product [Brassica oleracea]
MTGSTSWPELNDVVTAMYKIRFPASRRRMIRNRGGRWRSCLNIHILSSTTESLVCRARALCWTNGSGVHAKTRKVTDPFADYSDFWDSPAERIKQLAGDEFSSVPDWDTVDDGGWIEVRGDVLGETEKRVGYVDEDAETSSSLCFFLDVK